MTEKTGVMAKRAAIDAEVKKISRGAEGLIDEAKAFRNKVKKYLKEDVGKYISDFWYG